MAKRLRDVCKLREDENLWHLGRGFIVRDLPWTIEKLRKLPHFEFENWAVIALGGIPNKTQVGDMGIDGRLYPVGTQPKTKDDLFADDWFPIQVKQVDKVGRPDIDAFQAVMEREGAGGRKRGFFVAFGYTKPTPSAKPQRSTSEQEESSNSSPSRRFWMRSMCRRCEEAPEHVTI
jgi:hypothetical protein